MVMIAQSAIRLDAVVNPIDQKYHWGTASIQVAFSVFIATRLGSFRSKAGFVDRFGPKIVVASAACLSQSRGPLIPSRTPAHALRRRSHLRGRRGAVYGTCVGNALKMVSGSPGLPPGLTAAGFGAGAAATVVPIRDVILIFGYQSAFLWFGLGQGLVVLILSQFLRAAAG